MRTDKRVFMVGMTGVLAGLVAGVLMVAMLPAVAAVVGDPLGLGEVNSIDERTDLKGDAKGANLQIKNTGNSSALAAKAARQAVVAKATGGPVAINAKADRVAVKIKVDAGQAPLKVNASAGTATNLSADLLDGMDSTAFLGATETAANSEKVDGFDASGLVRVAFAASDDLPDGDEEPFVSGSGEADVLTVEIMAPVPGFLIMTGAIDAFSPSTPNVYRCRVVVDDVPVAGSEMTSDLGDTFTNDEEDCTTHGVVEVDAGAHTIDLNVGSDLFTLASTTNLDQGTLSVLFVPFDGAGTPADGMTDTAATSTVEDPTRRSESQ